MSAHFSRLREALSRPSAEEHERDIVAFHAVNPGITERTLGAARTEQGRTGYDLLALAVPPAARVVLDLGCGNGPLLASLLGHRPALESYLGVDACEPDAALARARFAGDPRVRVHTARAQSLPLEDASVDAVLSHHALYLFDPLEPALREVARVLRPGGLLAFATSSPESARYPLFGAMMRAMSERTVREAPHFKGWGDPRVWDREGLEGLLLRSPGGFDAPLRVEPYVLRLREEPAVLAHRLAEFFYSAQLHRPHVREGLERAWVELLAPTADAQGLAHFEWPLAQVELRRSGA